MQRTTSFPTFYVVAAVASAVACAFCLAFALQPAAAFADTTLAAGAIGSGASAPADSGATASDSGNATDSGTAAGSDEASGSDQATDPDPIDIADAKVAVKNQTYAAKALKPAVTVKVAGKKLVLGTDYKVKYKNNRVAGTARVIITGKGEYTGKATATFKIKRASLKKAKITGVKNKTYNGKKQTQSKLKVKMNGNVLTIKKSYTVSYKNNKNAGTATVIVKGKGNYTGTVKKTFKIKRGQMSKAVVSGVVDKEFNARPQTQDPKVKVGKRTLKENVDYRLTYAHNSSVGWANMYVQGLNNYEGTKLVLFRITKPPTKYLSATNATEA